MFLVDPPPSPGDLHFRLFGFPIRITPWFWIGAVLLGIGGDSAPEAVLTWVVVVLISILVHELGHAFAIRYFGESARITLYHLGGLAIGILEKLFEIYWGQPLLGGNTETWFAFVFALIVLLFRPQGLFGEKIIERV